MGESTEAGAGNQLSFSAFPVLYRTPTGCVLGQHIVGSVFVVMPDAIANQASRVSLAKSNHMIQQLSATALHPTLGHAVLPRTAIGCSDQAAAQGIEHLGNMPTK